MLFFVVFVNHLLTLIETIIPWSLLFIESVMDPLNIDQNIKRRRTIEFIRNNKQTKVLSRFCFEKPRESWLATALNKDETKS